MTPKSTWNNCLCINHTEIEKNQFISINIPKNGQKLLINLAVWRWTIHANHFSTSQSMWIKKHYTPVWYILTLSFLGGCPRSCYHHVNEPHFSVIFSSCQSGVIVIWKESFAQLTLFYLLLAFSRKHKVYFVISIDIPY